MFGALFIIFIVIACVFGGWWLFTSVFDAIFGRTESSNEYFEKTTHIHNHYHDNRTINVDGETFEKFKKNPIQNK